MLAHRQHYRLRDVDGREITPTEGRQIVRDPLQGQHQARATTPPTRRMRARRKQAAGQGSQESQSAPTSRPANTSIRTPEVA